MKKALIVLACVVSCGAILALALGWANELGFVDGVASVPKQDCTSEVELAAQAGYQQGVVNTVREVQVYILDSCTKMEEFTVAGEQFVCLKKQEM